jgi:hypothetical protein
MKILSSLILFLTLLVACKPGASSDTAEDVQHMDDKALEAKVLTIHDEIMPRMNEIGHLSFQLRKIVTDMKETPEGTIESPAGLDAVVTDLKLAEHDMWDWMKSYSDTKATLTPEQLRPFLEKELQKINKVKADMISSIENAQAWLAANPSK